MNEYHTQFQTLQDKATFRGQQWFGERQHLVEKYSWAVPNEEAINYLSEFDELIEIGAGNGYWAYCINNTGGNVQAYDISPPDGTWTDVAERDVKFMGVKDNAVLTVWPPCNEYVAGQLPEKKPAHILYVGEPAGGCTGDTQFFEGLSETYGLVAKIEIPSYVGINDNLFHYIRKI